MTARGDLKKKKLSEEGRRSPEGKRRGEARISRKL